MTASYHEPRIIIEFGSNCERSELIVPLIITVLSRAHNLHANKYLEEQKHRYERQKSSFQKIVTIKKKEEARGHTRSSVEDRC